MTYNPDEFETLPEIINAEQLRIACHMSKRTACYLLSSGLIPNQYNGKKTHCYRVRKSDVIAFVMDRAEHPDIYKAPNGWYKADSKPVKKQYAVRPLPPPIPVAIMKEYYEQLLAPLSDVLTTKDVCELTGYLRSTVAIWINKGWLKAILKTSKFYIPKCFLLEYLCSGRYYAIRRKSQKHMDALWVMFGRMDSTDEPDDTEGEAEPSESIQAESAD